MQSMYIEKKIMQANNFKVYLVFWIDVDYCSQGEKMVG